MNDALEEAVRVLVREATPFVVKGNRYAVADLKVAIADVKRLLDERSTASDHRPLWMDGIADPFVQEDEHGNQYRTDLDGGFY